MVFRCSIGDCTSSAGLPLVGMMTDAYGWPFSIAYAFLTLFVTFGVFNLIMAIYLENTLASAKSQDISEIKQRMERHRVAKALKEFLMKVCAAQRAVNNQESFGPQALHQIISKSSEEDLGDVLITRDTFIAALHDPAVQANFDDLDIESERQRLFDVFDADRSGYLGMRELIHGLLQVRGEAMRSDVLGAALGIRAVMGLLKEQHELLNSVKWKIESGERHTGDGAPNEQAPHGNAVAVTLETQPPWDTRSPGGRFTCACMHNARSMCRVTEALEDNCQPANGRLRPCSPDTPLSLRWSFDPAGRQVDGEQSDGPQDAALNETLGDATCTDSVSKEFMA
eukprot:NODE_9129_length_1445_cov_4.131259.p1 GENE.NODE_9129_length_1445_cov_4.131259~~NODE_9129_length_1445_cov_4.131259.p1  ORF type:complete len:365 (+),score=85.47 NODE_9129_length_1445_cov_4.131259:78-1097(+)